MYCILYDLANKFFQVLKKNLNAIDTTSLIHLIFKKNTQN